MLDVVIVIVSSVFIFGIVLFFIVKKTLKKRLDYLLKNKKNTSNKDN